MTRNSILPTVLMVSIGVILNSNIVFAQGCERDAIRFDVDVPIYISDFVITLEKEDCPSQDARVGPNGLIRIVPPGHPVYFCFRIQGSKNYLSDSRSILPLTVRVFIKNDPSGELYPFDGISAGKIDPKKAMIEASQNKGRFDWRTRVVKKVFHIPGDYVLSMTQGDNEICQISNQNKTICLLEFSVLGANC